MVTWLSLLSLLGIIVGVCVSGFGALQLFAAGMSDAPSEGAGGCVPLIVGPVLIAAGILGLVL